MMLDNKFLELYQKIDFYNRYEKLSKTYQFKDKAIVPNDEVFNLLASFGYKAKFIKGDNFFKIEDRVDSYKFYLNFCLKNANVELVVGASNLKMNQFITGSVFHGIAKDIEIATNQEREGYLRMPQFRNSNDLAEILSVALGIYEDFKSEILHLAQK